ncbi:MAG: Asp23/Gls24 family envelope stress response protein [Chloroflexota bacterium]|nr:Asp23/Gls24 family envelope stress response protein [Chloroflexota bacterium]
MPLPSIPGHALVTRRVIAEEVRRVALSSYGVVGIGGRGRGSALLGRLTRSVPGVQVSNTPDLDVDVYLSIALGLPVAQVAQNVAHQVRYALRSCLGREPAAVRIHVERVRPPAAVRRGREARR